MERVSVDQLLRERVVSAPSPARPEMNYITLSHDQRKLRYVYLVQEEWYGWVKIGMTENLHARVNALQAGCPQNIKLLGWWQGQNALAFERNLHDHFCERPRRREWFQLTCEDLQDLFELKGFVRHE